MQKIKLQGAGGYIMTKAQIKEKITEEAPIYKEIEKSSHDRFIILQGDMKNALIHTAIIKNYKGSDPIAISEKMAVYGI